jgi:hypothetical protein
MYSLSPTTVMIYKHLNMDPLCLCPESMHKKCVAIMNCGFLTGSGLLCTSCMCCHGCKPQSCVLGPVAPAEQAAELDVRGLVMLPCSVIWP